jgi:hypothetical protein
MQVRSEKSELEFSAPLRKEAPNLHAYKSQLQQSQTYFFI